MLKLVVTDDVLYINDGAIILSKWVCDSHHEKIIVRDAFGFPIVESKMPVETQNGERAEASDVISDIGANWKSGAGFGDYYQWIIQGKSSDIVALDGGGYAYENYGTGGEVVRTDILNTQVATFDGTAYLQGKVDQFNDIGIIEHSGTSTPSIDYVNSRILFTSGYIYKLKFSNGVTYYFQESNGSVLYYINENVSDLYVIYDNTYIPDNENYVMRDLFLGRDIDLTKWSITNPDPTKVAFTQNNYLELQNLALGATGFMSNRINTISSILTGTAKFSLSTTRNYSNMLIGLMADTNNRITFVLDASGNKLDYYVVQNGSVKQYIAGAANVSSGNYKIVLGVGDSISAYQWLNSEWQQIGTTVSFAMGGAMSFFATIGGDAAYEMSYIRIDDIFLTENDFATLNP